MDMPDRAAIWVAASPPRRAKTSRMISFNRPPRATGIDRSAAPERYSRCAASADLHVRRTLEDAVDPGERFVLVRAAGVLHLAREHALGAREELALAAREARAVIAHGQVADHLGDLEDVPGLDLVAVASEAPVPVALDLDVSAVSVRARSSSTALADHATHPAASRHRQAPSPGDRSAGSGSSGIHARRRARPGSRVLMTHRTLVRIDDHVADVEHARDSLAGRAPPPGALLDSRARSTAVRGSGSGRERVLLQPAQGLADLARTAAVEPVDVLELAQGTQQRFERPEARRRGRSRSRR